MSPHTYKNSIYQKDWKYNKIEINTMLAEMWQKKEPSFNIGNII